MINFIVVQGNLVADPVLMKTKGGASVSNARIACRRDVKGTKQNADFIRLSCWDANAERLCDYKKGDNITVIGRLEEGQRVTKEGAHFSTYDIRVSHIANADFGDALVAALNAE